MEQEHFSFERVSNGVIFSLFFKRAEGKQHLLDLYLAGSVMTTFKIRMDDIVNEKGETIENWLDNERAVLVDKVKITPRKELQKLLGKKMTADEIKSRLSGDYQASVDALLKSLFIKINNIYAKQKLYGRQVKNFDLLGLEARK